MSDRHLLLVVGVGRSGTSLLSGMLGQLGFRIPQPEVKADATNPRGFGEPRWVVDFHTRILRERRVTVNDARPAAWAATGTVAPAARAELRAWLAAELREPGAVLVKDPRTVWFLPLWMGCAAELGVRTSFVTMLRHPAEIVTSARRSYGPGLTEAGRAAAWINVILQTEQVTREAPRAFVRHEDLLADWPPEIRRLGARLDVPSLAAVDRAGSPEVDAFVDPGLHRSRTSWDDLDVPGRVRDLAEAVWEHFSGAPGGEVPAAALDADRAAYDALYAEAEAIAQCSVMAARARPKRPAARPAPPSLRGRLARRVPQPYRRRLRLLIRRLGA